MKTLILRTTAGTAQVQIQLVTAGLGEGRDILATITSNALDRHLTPVVIIHDLRGEIRNCGCPAGSLGGIEVLAALPGTLRHTVPSARFVLAGDTNGSRDGGRAALVDHGWSRDDNAIVVSADPLAALNQPDVLAVIPSVPVQANHRRLLIPLVSGGMVAEVLLVDGQNQIVEHVRLPIDRTLAEDCSVLERFPERLLLHLDEHTVPSSACTACHAGAHQTWVGSRHAAALSSLGPKDQVDACITCHSTPVSPGVVAGGVQCQACHRGAAAHAQGAGRVRTTGTTDCQTCHDGRHHPGFKPVAAWEAIAHGHSAWLPPGQG